MFCFQILAKKTRATKPSKTETAKSWEDPIEDPEAAGAVLAATCEAEEESDLRSQASRLTGLRILEGPEEEVILNGDRTEEHFEARADRHDS